ncbi:MAG: response regulator [Prochloraceae cyanobacterium]
MQTINNETKLSQPIIQLEELAKRNFTGSLSIENENGLNWKIYFRLGRLIWVTSEAVYFKEEWQRHIDSFLANLNDEKRDEILNQNEAEYYTILAQLYRQGNPQDKQNITELITSIFVETLFDLIQWDALNKERLSYITIANEKPESLVTLIKTDLVSQKALAEWKEWNAAGLSSYYPSYFLAIEDLNAAQQQLNPKLISLIDGTKSLRFLAAKTGLELAELIKYLLPDLKAGAISLQEFPTHRKPDLESFKAISSSSNEDSIFSPLEPEKPSFLVLCVDDSPVICQDMEKIVSESSYRFISLQDPVKAIPFIIKNSPDFIFLDLMMPVVSGYELCAQLRKIPNFKDVPIVILTGKDGLVDRVRAKVVGATAFISKPANPEEVLGLLKKHLPVK